MYKPLLPLLLAALPGCTSLAIATAPEKTPAPSTSELATRAKATFRETLAKDDFDALPESTELLTQAYLQSPRDGELALLTAHAHLWRVAERERGAQRATVTDDLVVAEKYFSEAKRLRPDDHRIDGWLGPVRLALGTIHQDEKLVRTGYFEIKDGASDYPQFNLFVIGYAMAGAPRTSDRFKEAVDAMWKTLDVCAGSEIDRARPEYVARQGQDRVCGNDAKAPHNFEGFFLTMGDMLVKNGEPEKARAIYANARRVPGFATWKWKGVLETHEREADLRAKRYEADESKMWPNEAADSAPACVRCHAR
jgi:hypothetical protein